MVAQLGVQLSVIVQLMMVKDQLAVGTDGAVGKVGEDAGGVGIDEMHAVSENIATKLSEAPNSNFENDNFAK